MDVYILAGQSNMEGRAHRKDLPQELARPRPDILYFCGDTWEPLAPGGSRKPPSPDGFGPEITFGRTLANAPGRTNRV
ncbi:MAG: hypothetical protein KDH09_18575, partial [Chrysiogenetes bacterium]|nr:hypothetical protein [Chrysiogenetes bacterium]